MSRIADRLRDIQPFYVMELLARARDMEARGRSVIHMEIGEPDFPTAEPIVQAGIAALQAGETRYTPSLGMWSLREAVAAHYEDACRPPPSRVVITPGASGALQLVFAALVNPGDEVLLTDPGYPCNRHFVRLFEGRSRSVPVGPETRFQLTAELVRRHWTDRTVAVLLASPSNPAGTTVPDAEMAAIAGVVRERGGVLIVDEIYRGLSYDGASRTALRHGDDIFVVNSFSKYYGMTGWRLGWAVVPEACIDAVDRLAQNIFIAAATPAQHAALAAFRPEVIAELERRRAIFHKRRDALLPALRELGFVVPVVPDGAFYLYADCSAFTGDSYAFALEALEQTGVAITPGKDFGSNRPERFVRFSYANDIERLLEAVDRLRTWLPSRA